MTTAIRQTGVTDAVTTVKRFHAEMPGMPLLYHTYCSECPDYGICDEYLPAHNDALAHQISHRTA